MADMKWSEVPVGKIVSRRDCEKARWVKTVISHAPPQYGSLLLIDREGTPNCRNLLNEAPLIDNGDGFYLTGEKLVVGQIERMPDAIVLRIEKADSDLKPPVSFQYDESVFQALYALTLQDYEQRNFDRSEINEVAKAMFDAGIAHAANSIDLPAIRGERYEAGYKQGKNDALAETEDMFEKGVEHERKRQENASGQLLPTPPEMLQAAKEFREAEDRLRAITSRLAYLVRQKNMKPKRFLRELRDYIVALDAK